MRDLWRSVSENQVVSCIADLLPEGTVLVGGCIRDFFLGIDPQDIDIIVPVDVWVIARRIAHRFNTTPFWLDKECRVARISIPDTTLDIAAPRKPTIEEDLWMRDLSINALAYDIKDRKIIDPTGGIDDLKTGLIRILSEETLMQDPLRALRCIRFSLQFGFSITEESYTLLRRHAPEGIQVAPERIKQELVKALSLSSGARYFSLLDATGYLQQLFPDMCIFEGSPCRDLLGHAILTVECVDRLLPEIDVMFPGSREHFQTSLESGVSRMVVLTLAGFLHDLTGMCISRTNGHEGRTSREPFVGALKAEGILRRYAFSTRAGRAIRSIIQGFFFLEAFAEAERSTKRILHRFCSRTGSFVPETLVLVRAHDIQKADTEEQRRREILERTWSYFTGEFQQNRRSPLVTGQDVIHELGIKPGPSVGSYLNSIEEARAEGEITTPEQARALLRKLGTTHRE
ncbi:MAG TPA: CCA tRNA nucleotidyltransferase [Deltaproteobacteria bacterium]|nr:CCA tRNA nucleotidyltransferase [Deltaproteobacteria bacterium]